MKIVSQDIFEPEKPVVPSDWKVLPFEQAADVVSDKGKRVKQGAYLLTGKIPVIDQGQEMIGGYTDEEGMAFDDELPVILFGDHTRSLKYVDKRFAVGAEGVKILRPREGCVPKFFYYLLRSLQIPSRGYSRHFQFLRKFHLPLAPEEQQKRIVAEIEKQFSRLDEAVANLQRVRRSLTRYYASLLSEVVGSDQELCAQVTVGSLLREPIVNGLSVKESATPTPVRALRLSAMTTTELNFADHRFLPIEASKVEDIVVKQGDFFVSRGNGSLSLVGRGVTAQTPPFPVIFPDTMMRLRFADAEVARWVAMLWPSRHVRSQIEQRVKTTAGIYKMAQPQVASITLPMPPLAKRQMLVAEVDRRLSIVRGVESEVDANLKRAQALRQAVLAKAFSVAPQTKAMT